ncbi:MAG: aminotransferase class IV, partial [Myxococcota bacterium]|nr:aminotransferase class IV [Myxococcota bacterium]
MTVDRTIWFNGQYVPWEAAHIHLLSHAAQRGSLVFDYMSVYELPQGDAIFRMPEHLERFDRSCELIGLRLAYSSDVLSEAVLETVRRNPGSSAVKISAFISSVEVDVVPVDDEVGVAIAAYDPAADVLAHKRNPVAKKADTCRLWIEKQIHNRREDIVSPQAKVAANYVSTMAAKERALAAGHDDIILIDEYGHVAEAPTANIFCVDAEGTLLTPEVRRVLLGVTRSTIIELARASGVEVREAAITPEALMEAREVFLTGTTAGVWPCVSVDDRAIGNGEIGPVAKTLQERFARLIAGDDP